MQSILSFEEYIMNSTVTLTLPKSLFQRAEQLAHVQNKEMSDLLVEVLQTSIPSDATIRNPILTYEVDQNVEREKEAYEMMHPDLWEKFPGQYVAIYGEQLVDHDLDLNVLWDRVEEQFPDAYVWVTEVTEKPIETIRIPSFQLEVNSR